MDARPCVSFVFRAQASDLSIPCPDPRGVGLGALTPEQARMAGDALRELSLSCESIPDAGAIGIMAGELLRIADTDPVHYRPD